MLVNVQRRTGEGNMPPVRFQLDHTEYLVDEVLDQWFGTDSTFFKLKAHDGNLYILRHKTTLPDVGWSLESFRRED